MPPPQTYQEVKKSAHKELKLQASNMQVVAFLGRPEKKSQLLIIGKENIDKEDSYDAGVSRIGLTKRKVG